MGFLLSLAKMAALAATVALVLVHWLSPLNSALIAVGLLYLLLVRVS